MQLAFLDHYMTMEKCSSRQALLSLLDHCHGGKIILGEDTEAVTDYYLAIIALGPSNIQKLGIGVLSEGHGLKPNVLLLPQYSRLVFGFDKFIVGLDIPSGKIAFSSELDSLFFKFIEIPEKQIVIIQHEIGIKVHRYDGKLIWQYSKDIIVDLKLNIDAMIISFLDSQPIMLDIMTGREIT